MRTQHPSVSRSRRDTPSSGRFLRAVNRDRTSEGTLGAVVRIELPCPRVGRRWEGVVGSREAIMPNVPWNKGRLTGQKQPLKPKDVWAIRVRLHGHPNGQNRTQTRR